MIDAGGAAVIGLGCRFPGGAETPEAFWDLLVDGVDVLGDLPRDRWDAAVLAEADRVAGPDVGAERGFFIDDLAGWDPDLFGVSVDEARRIDPQQRLVLDVAWRALEDAAIDLGDLRSMRTGVFVGVSDGQQYNRLQHQCTPGCALDPFLAVGSSSSMAAGRLAYVIDAHGPCLTIDTACSTGLVCIHLARQSLTRRECDLAVVAAASAVTHPESYGAARRMGMLAPDGRTKAFDRRADGFSLGEGAAAVVLQREDEAAADGRRIRAVIAGSAVGHGGRGGGLTAPSTTAQVQVVRDALGAALVPPDDVEFVETHGSATVLGDAIELDALREVFGPRDGDRVLHLGAVKSNIGHTLTAAGMAGLVKAVLAVEHGVLPPNLHLTAPNPILRRTTWLAPVVEAVPLGDGGRPPVGGVSAFAWTGTNAHVVLRPPAPRPEPIPASEPVGAVVLTLAARSVPALTDLAERLAADLEAGRVSVADAARTLQWGRRGHPIRRAVVADPGSPAAAARACRTVATDPPPAGGAPPPRVAFVFPAHLAMAPSVAAELLAGGAGFQEAVDDALEAGRRAGHFGGLDELGIGGFAVQCGIAASLRRAGVEPDLVIGWGVGEHVASYVAGERDLDDAVWTATATAWSNGSAPVRSNPFTHLAAPADVAVAIGGAVPAGGGSATIAVLGDRAQPGSPIPAALARLWELGVDVDWPAVSRPVGRIVTLPPHPFTRRRCWVDRVGPAPVLADAPPALADGPPEVVEPVPVGDRGPRPVLQAPYAPARTDLQRELVDIWEAYIGVEPVGIDDRFLELGGRSVVVAAILVELEGRLGTSINPGLLFEHPTIRELAAALGPAAPLVLSTEPMPNRRRRGSDAVRARRQSGDARSAP